MTDETKPIWHDLIYWATYAGQCLVLAVERQPVWALTVWAVSLIATWWWL
jgi:hypothetical protein